MTKASQTDDRHKRYVAMANGEDWKAATYPTEKYDKQADSVVHCQKRKTSQEEIEQIISAEQKRLNAPHDKVLTITKADGAKVEVANLSMAELESLLKQLA